MVAKLVLLIAAVLVFVVAATAATVWYLNRESEREHEKELKRMEHTEQMVREAERETSIDSRLERETDEE